MKKATFNVKALCSCNGNWHITEGKTYTVVGVHRDKYTTEFLIFSDKHMFEWVGYRNFILIEE